LNKAANDHRENFEPIEPRASSVNGRDAALNASDKRTKGKIVPTPAQPQSDDRAERRYRERITRCRITTKSTRNTKTPNSVPQMERTNLAKAIDRFGFL
jgi:hypothetical protein